MLDFHDYCEPDSDTLIPEDSSRRRIRTEKAIAQSQKRPASIDTVIRLTNDILMSAGIQPVLDPIISGTFLQDLLSGNPYGAYRKIRDEYSQSDLIWMKFTSSGHLGAVGAGDSLHFDEEDPSSEMIRVCGQDWDRSFVLVFPVRRTGGMPLLRRKDRDAVEMAVRRYLISEDVPVLDCCEYRGS